MNEIVTLLLFIATGASVGALVAIARNLGRIAKALEGRTEGHADGVRGGGAPRGLTDESRTVPDPVAQGDRARDLP